MKTNDAIINGIEQRREAADFAAFARGIMEAVARIVRDAGQTLTDYGRACEIMRERAVAFLMGEGEYHSVRLGILNGEVGERAALADLVLAILEDFRREGLTKARA